MITNNLSLDFKPSQYDFELLMNELRSEGVDSFGHGLVNNIDYLYALYERNNFISLLSQGQPIGFATWRKNMNTAHIDFIWIKPSYRKKGIGRAFQELLNIALRRKRIYLLSIDAVSEDGKALASAVGFRNLCDSDYSRYHHGLQDENKYLFIKEGRYAYSTPSGIGTELIIWSSFNTNDQPSLCFTLDDNLKRNPILAIVNRDASMEIRINGHTLKQETIKYFFKEDKELQNGYFLYLNNLPAAIKSSFPSNVRQ